MTVKRYEYDDIEPILNALNTFVTKYLTAGDCNLGCDLTNGDFSMARKVLEDVLGKPKQIEFARLELKKFEKYFQYNHNTVNLEYLEKLRATLKSLLPPEVPAP